MSTNRRNVYLDLMRRCAALLDCANHLRAVTMASYHSLADGSLFLQAFHAATRFGHQAVIIFFVLSGYFVGGSLLAKGSAFSLRSYAIGRLTRLWVVLILALLLTAGIDHVLHTSAPEVLSGAYAGVWNHGPQPGGDYSASAAVFLGNLFFLQQIFLPVFGSNDPLWSLAYEFWYYAAFPLLLVGVGRGLERRSVMSRCLAVAAVALILAFLPWSGRVGFLCWLGGVAVYALRGHFPAVNVLMALVVFVAGLGFSRWMGSVGVAAAIVDLEMALVTMILVAALASKSATVTVWRPVAWLSYHLSEMSYTLYLVHFPLALCIGGIVLRGDRLLPDAAGLATYLGWFCATLVLAWCFWFAFERRTYQIRQLVQQAFARRWMS